MRGAEGERLARTLAANVRPADRDEWEAASGKPFDMALWTALLLNHNHTWMLLHDDRCLMLFGVSPYEWNPTGVGAAWLVATKEAEEKVHTMHRFFRQGIAELHKVCPKLNAWAYHKNKLHHEWMRRMGFKDTGGRCPIGSRGEMFHLFTKDA